MFRGFRGWKVAEVTVEVSGLVVCLSHRFRIQSFFLLVWGLSEYLGS